ncbi:hypothetical protein HMI49_02485 [Corallococcus exercitus]|uniref:Uncharacterized protein n=2 Tax=Corallococcus exercitus TaxID=2316736 RepID=A0A7Y4KE24_9BACT|nr:hypothetical protein [Corallococcus exercitus]
MIEQLLQQLIERTESRYFGKYRGYVTNAHSVIILGGSRVAAVGNATTSGVHVQEADAVVELNP